MTMTGQEGTEYIPAKKIIADLANRCYAEAYEAKAKGEKIGWCASNFPVEICETLGIPVVYPENQAAAIAAKGGGLEMCEHAEAKGYSNDLCAYARINLAYADVKDCEQLNMPMPDFVLCCNNICNCMMKWYENLAFELKIPMIFIDIPYNEKYEVDEKRTAYIKAQFEEAIQQLEEITGKSWDEKRFAEVMAISNRTARAWLKAANYSQYVPSPFSGFDLFNHMAAAVVARGKVEAAEAFEQLIEEFEQSVKDGTSTFKVEEEYRVLFEGIACWPHLRTTFKGLKDNGINVTATVYADAFGIFYGNTDELMQAYCNVPNCINFERATDLREAACRLGKVDGAVVHINRSCKLWSGIAPAMGRRISEDLGIPVITFDGDQADPRNFSEAQYHTRIQGLMEIMAANKQGRE